jgi:uncharacterized protein
MLQEVSNKKAGAIGKISVITTEACNLSCKYCYEKRPLQRWNNKQSMSPNVIDHMLEEAVKWKSCDLIQFFGGEPTLNLDVIEYTCSQITKLVASGELAAKPRLAVVSNGCYANSNKVLRVLKENNIETTISLDGPEPLNDELRRSRKHDSVFGQASTTLKKLLSLDIPVALETVFTKTHIDNGYTIIDSIKFAQENNVNKFFFQPAYPSVDASLDPMCPDTIDIYLKYHMDAIDWWFGNFLSKGELYDIYYLDILRMMMLSGNTPSKSICPAGQSTFSIGPDGAVYPCQLLHGNSQLLIGNITSDNFDLRSQTIPILHEEFDCCNGCYARYFCQPCAALNDFFGNIANPPRAECKIRQAVILRIAQWAIEKLNFPRNRTTLPLIAAIESLG